jgi:hypothetical protein
MTRDATCCQCEHFVFRDAEGQPYPQLAHGMARCKGYDGHVAPVEPFVRWDGPYCVMFGKAKSKDMAERRAWIDKQIAKKLP